MANTQRRKLILSCCIFLLILSFSDWRNQLSLNTLETTYPDQPHEVPVLSNYTTHDSILIESNSDFETQGWPGNGSVSNPYVIAGLNITGDDGIIRIQSTSVYFIIQDCYLSATSWNTPISIVFSGNALINNCIIEGRYGIYLYHSNYVVFQNSIMKVDSYPIRTQLAYGFKITNCTFQEIESGTFPRTVRLESSNFAIVEGNVFHGVYLIAERSTGVSITSNNFTEGGILLQWSAPSTYSNVSNNRIDEKPLLFLIGNESLVIEADDYGQVILVDCSNIVVQNGTMEDTRPVQLSSCVGCTIINITATHGVTGIYDFDSNFTTIRNCVFNAVSNGGIWMTYCGSSLIENCTSYPEEYFSHSSRFIVQACINTTVTRCKIINQENEALYFTGENMTLSHCIIEGARQAAHVRGINMIVDNNHIYSTTSEHTTPFFSAGIYTRYLKESTISNNLIENGDDYGIFAFSNDTRFVNNTIINNEGIGIELLNFSHGNFLYGNVLENNLEGNALDNGFDNQWDDGISIGNIWDDYNPQSSSLYQVPGTARSVDRFPQTNTVYPTTITNSTTTVTTTLTTTSVQEQTWEQLVILIIVSGGSIIIVIVIVLRKRMLAS